MVSISDLKFYKSNNAGLGGGIDITAPVISGEPNNLFPMATKAEVDAEQTRYLLLYIKNTSDETVKDLIFWKSAGSEGDYSITFWGRGSSGKNGTEPTITDMYDAPSGIVWRGEGDTDEKLDSNFESNATFPIWFKAEIDSDAPNMRSNEDIFKFKCTVPGGNPPPPPPDTTSTRKVYYATAKSNDGNYTQVTRVICEETVESLTDPDPFAKYGPKSFYEPESPTQEEIGDQCDGIFDTYADGLQVKEYWSNNDNNCVAPHISETDLGGSTKIENPDDGPVLKNAKIYLVYWGTDWTTRGSAPTMAGLTDKIQNDLLGTDVEYFSKLSQYKDIEAPTWGGAVANTKFPIPSGDIQKPDDVTKFLTDTFNRGLLAKPADINQNIYIVILPVDKTLVNQNNVSIGGFHDVYKPNISVTPSDPPPTDSTTNWKIGIVGDTDPDKGATDDVLDMLDSRTKIIMCGDYAYGNPGDILDKFDDHHMKTKILGFPMGNHEEDDGYLDFCNWYGISKSKTWFMRKWENVAVITADSNIDPDGAQHDDIMNFITSAENDSNIDWIFMCMHHPWFGSGSDHDNNNNDIVQAFHNRMATSKKGAMVFTGHNHNWQRSKKCTYNSSDAEDPNITDSSSPYVNDTNGIIHVVSGTGGHDSGSSLYPLKDALGTSGNPNGFQNRSNNGIYELVASNGGKTLTCRFVATDNDTFDTLTYTTT